MRDHKNVHPGTVAAEVHDDPYPPSKFAMEAAVELEVHAALGRIQTQTVGKIIQRAIDKETGRLRAEVLQCSVELGEAAKLIPYPRTAGLFEEAAGRARVSIGLTPREPPAQ